MFYNPVQSLSSQQKFRTSSLKDHLKAYYSSLPSVSADAVSFIQILPIAEIDDPVYTNEIKHPDDVVRKEWPSFESAVEEEPMLQGTVLANAPVEVSGSMCGSVLVCVECG